MPSLFSLLLICTWIALILFSAFLSKLQFVDKKEFSRKIVHIGIGPVLPIAWWLEISSSIAISIASIITIALLINYRMQLIDVFEDVERKSYGTIAYGISITLLLVFFWSKSPEADCAGVLVMAFGDGFAGLIGKQVKSKNWTILGQNKSIIGTFTMSLITGLVLFLINVVSGSTLQPLEIFAITFIATGLEQISPLGIDNLTVPIGVAIGWHYLA